MAKFTGQGVYKGFSPYIGQISDMISSAIIQNAKRKREQEALAGLLDRYTKSQSNINERYKTGEPTTIPGGEVTTPNISALPTQNVSSMGRSADFNIPRGTESSTYNLNERPQNRMVSNILNPNAIPIEPQSGNSYRPTNKIMDISVEDLRKLANSDIELPEGGIRRNAPQQGIVPDTTMQMPDDIFLGDISEIPQEERYGRAVNEANTFLAQGLSDQDLDLGRLQLLADALNQQAAGLKPKEFEPFSMSPGEKRAVRLKKNPQPGEDPYEWVENPKPIEPESKEDIKVQDWVGSDLFPRTQYKRANPQEGEEPYYTVKGDTRVRERPYESESGGGDRDKEEKEVSNLLGTMETQLKALERDKNNYEITGSEAEHKAVRADLEGNAVRLVNRTGLSKEANMMWDVIKEGDDMNTAFTEVNEYRKENNKKPLTDKQYKYLKYYFRAKKPTKTPKDERDMK